MSGFAALKPRRIAADPERVNEEIWFDIDDGPAPQAALAQLEAAVHPAIGRRLFGLAILCAVLFGLATLVGFAAEAYAASPGPTPIVKTLGYGGDARHGRGAQLGLPSAPPASAFAVTLE